MCSQSTTQEDSALGVTPSIQPAMPWRLTAVKVLPGYRLHVVFVDGTKGEVDMHGLIHSQHAGVFGVLADQALFARAFIEHGAVTWPGELDLAPDAIHADIKRTGTCVLR